MQPQPANEQPPKGSQWDRPRGVIIKTLSKTGLLAGIHAHCRECMGVEKWIGDVDCVDATCALYPARPGDGPGRASAPRKKVAESTLQGLAKARKMKAVAHQNRLKREGVSQRRGGNGRGGR